MDKIPHSGKLEREDQKRIAWEAYLKDCTQNLKYRSRRKQLGNQPRGGNDVYAGDDPRIATDVDEHEGYDFWEAT